MGKKITVALAGNPNVGKSTVFNGLTGLKQHTGNWTGKTVEAAEGRRRYKDGDFVLVDLPGTYSLSAGSKEEEAAFDYIKSQKADAIIVVADATALERNLILALQILEINKKTVLALNMMDEAAAKKIVVDREELSRLLGIPVIPIVARKKKQLLPLLDAAREAAQATQGETQGDGGIVLGGKKLFNKTPPSPCVNSPSAEQKLTEIAKRAESIAAKAVTCAAPDAHVRDRKIDKILTSKIFGFPIMLLLLGLVFYLTIELSNYPSRFLTKIFAFLEGKLNQGFSAINTPWWLHKPLMDGVYKTLAWVVAVMLPPMAIFFPLFTFLEDLGYLPRVAFNLDRPFRRCGCCGKQCLTMCMGFGCNAVGVTGTRIIDSERERLIAILTNNFVPCNGRFPTLLTVSAIFIGGTVANSFLSGVISALALTIIVMFGIIMTLLISFFLSKTLLRGKASSFSLELPPYRRPQIGKILTRSFLDRTLKVLGRAVAVAAPAGLLIWLLANINAGSQPLIYYIASFLAPLGKLMGLDGYTLTAFALGFPANEIVVPVTIMSYSSTGVLTDFESAAGLGRILAENGWTWASGVSMLIFTLLHFPCATTCLTIRKETKSWKWTGLAMLLPTVLGIAACMLFTAAVKLF